MTAKPEMTGPQHYRAAEKVLADASGMTPEFRAVRLAEAQVHATLALAAATAASGSTPAATADQEWNHIAWEI